MTFSASLMTIRWLIRDTFRQSVASRIFWVMLLLSGIAILLCLSVGISGDAKTKPRAPGELNEFLGKDEAKRIDPFYLEDDPVNVIQGQMTILFGAVQAPLGRTRLEAVRNIQLILAGGVADTVGVLLALIWTAGFLPTFLEPASVTVLLAKPIPRWSLLAGKFLGVLLFLLVQVTVFVGGTWLALGLRTNVWNPLYLLSIPLLLLHFAIFFSFSTFLAVWTRSTVTCVFGSILFWIVCWTMNYAHNGVTAMRLDAQTVRLRPVDARLLIVAPAAPLAPAALPWPGLATWSEPKNEASLIPVSPVLLDVGYWLLPKPADLGNILFHALDANNYFSQLTEYDKLRRQGAFHPELAVFSSLAFMLLLLALAGYEFVHTDY